jgi:hypothetical protein
MHTCGSTKGYPIFLHQKLIEERRLHNEQPLYLLLNEPTLKAKGIKSFCSLAAEGVFQGEFAELNNQLYMQLSYVPVQQKNNVKQRQYDL